MSARLLFATRGLLSPDRIRHSNRWRTLKSNCRCAATNNVAGQVAAEVENTVLRQSQRMATNTTRSASTRVGMANNERRDSVSIDDIELPLADGMVLRGQRWSCCCQRQELRNDSDDGAADSNSNNTTQFRPPSTKTRILALHGWLDNCRSFHILAPKLIEKFQQSTTTEAELVAIDLPGHGWSSHRSIDGPITSMTDSAYYVAEIIDALGWGDGGAANNNDAKPKRHNNCGVQPSIDNPADGDDGKVALIGHSMGGAIASIYAGVFPEQISGLVSIDIYGPEPERSGKTASRIRSHVSQRRSVWGPFGKPHTIYPSLEKAIERRRKAATMIAGRGSQYLSEEAAKEIVTRSMEAIYEHNGRAGEYSDGNNKTNTIQGYRFRHDARWLWPSLQYLTADQIDSILQQVECPVCIIAGEDGYPFSNDRIERTIAALKPEVYEVLPGSHHLHADPDTANAVVDAIYDFFGVIDDSNNHSDG